MSARPAVVQLGDEMRPVPFARDGAVVATVERATPRDGRIRAATALQAQGLGAGRLQLYWALAGGTRFARHDKAWQLYVHPRRPAWGKIVLAVPLRDLKADVALRLERIPPMPGRLESEPFDLPSGTTIELGYGLAPAALAGSTSAVAFTATLDCAWAWPQVLVDARAGDGGAPAGAWYGVSVRQARGRRSCRLALEATSQGGDLGDAVWAIPRLHVPAEGAAAPPDANVVLISLDTLRADHLSGYGYLRRTTPRIDHDLIARGTTFTDASTTFPVTNTAHLGIFTSRYPSALPASGTLPDAARIRMLTEELRDAGFTTVGVTEDGLVSAAYGFAWGFDRLVERYHAPVDGARRVFEEGDRAVRELRDRRFFLFLHTYKVHDPYTPAEPYRNYFPPSPDDPAHRHVPEQHRASFDEYDRCIREADEHVAGFLRTLDELGLSERTIVVLLSDHGEAFGEHVAIGHGFSPQQEAMHVPLVFRGPGIGARRRVATPVSLVDVMPTILELLGLPAPPGGQGRSLRDALAGRPLAPRPVFFEWIGPANVGMRDGSRKIERSGDRYRTYDLRLDPLEQRPRGDAAPEHVAEVARYVEQGAALRRASDAGDAPNHISPEVHDALRALGYVE